MLATPNTQLFIDKVSTKNELGHMGLHTSYSAKQKKTDDKNCRLLCLNSGGGGGGSRRLSLKAQAREDAI